MRDCSLDKFYRKHVNNERGEVDAHRVRTFGVVCACSEVSVDDYYAWIVRYVHTIDDEKNWLKFTYEYFISLLT